MNIGKQLRKNGFTYKALRSTHLLIEEQIIWRLLCRGNLDFPIPILVLVSACKIFVRLFKFMHNGNHYIKKLDLEVKIIIPTIWMFLDRF